jgi:hypothetical protein
MPKVRTDCIQAKFNRELKSGLNEIYAQSLLIVGLKYLIFAAIRIENHEVEEYLFCSCLA